jgi:hypothetical protein
VAATITEKLDIRPPLVIFTSSTWHDTLRPEIENEVLVFKNENGMSKGYASYASPTSIDRAVGQNCVIYVKIMPADTEVISIVVLPTNVSKIVAQLSGGRDTLD